MRWIECTAAAYQEPPSARMGHTAALVDAKRSWGEELLVVHGGLNALKEPLGDLTVLQTMSEAWFRPNTANAGPPPRAFHSAAAMGELLFIFGGHIFLRESKGLQKFNDLWCLNTDNWEWSAVHVQPTSPKPSPRDFLGMVALPCQKLLIFGGLDGAEKRLDDTWVFDCTTSSWTELTLPGPKPKARYAHALVRVDQRVLLCGGESNTGLLSDLWILKGVVTPEDEKPAWVPLELPGPSPSPRKAHAVAALGWQVVVFGGHASEAGWFTRKTDVYHNDITVMDRQGTVQWRSIQLEGELPLGREYHTLTPTSQARLLLFGGGNGKVIFSDAWWLCMDEDEVNYSPSKHQGTLLMEQDRDLQGGMIRTHSSMSEISGVVEPSLLSTSELVTARNPSPPRDTRGAGERASADPQVTHQEATASQAELGDTGGVWWTGSSAAKKFSSLHRNLRIPHQPVVPPSNASDENAFQQLAQEVWNARPLKGSNAKERDQDLLLDATREYLLSATPEMLKMKEVRALLWDYRLLCRARRTEQTLTNMSELEMAWEQSILKGGRFCHMQAKNLRLGDLAALHSEYKALVQGSGATGSLL